MFYHFFTAIVIGVMLMAGFVLYETPHENLLLQIFVVCTALVIILWAAIKSLLEIDKRFKILENIKLFEKLGIVKITDAYYDADSLFKLRNRPSDFVHLLDDWDLRLFNGNEEGITKMLSRDVEFKMILTEPFDFSDYYLYNATWSSGRSSINMEIVQKRVELKLRFFLAALFREKKTEYEISYCIVPAPLTMRYIILNKEVGRFLYPLSPLECKEELSITFSYQGESDFIKNSLADFKKIWETHESQNGIGFVLINKDLEKKNEEKIEELQQFLIKREP